MAVEDAAALAEALAHVEDPSKIHAALHIYQKVRAKRSGQMQQASLINGTIWHFADGPEQEARDASMRNEVVGEPFTESANQWSDPVTQSWAYGYNACEAVSRELSSRERGL